MTPPSPLCIAWIMLQAEYWTFWGLHWKSKGTSYYGDHLLYERLYRARRKEIDRLAELIIAIEGADRLSVARAVQAVAPIVDGIERMQIPDAQKGLVAANMTLSALRQADAASQGSPYALAVSNALATFSENQMEAVYLLKQRLNGQLPPVSPPAPEMAGFDEDRAFDAHPRRAVTRDQLRRARATRAPQILDGLGAILNSAITDGNITKSIGWGAALGGLIYGLTTGRR